jgi:lysyl-tRNA synthetase, class II
MTDNDDDHPDGNHLIAERRAKLAKIRERGIAFPNDFRRDALAADLLKEHGDEDAAQLDALGREVSIAGRLRAKRIMGRASFAKVEDPSGEIQIFLQRDALGDVYEDFKTWDLGDVIGATGTLFRTKTGELTVKVDEARLLTKALRPLPDKWHGISDTELRYRQRYVDLIMNGDSRRVFRTRSRIVKFLRDYLDGLGFLEVETPMLQPIPGGAAARPFKTHHNALDMDMYLRIAPELYLKRLTVGGFERVYEINRNFRNEGLSTQHNPEFTMLELYQAFADYDDFMSLVENMFRGVADMLQIGALITYQGQQYDLGRPFARMTIEEIVMRNNPQLDAGRLRDLEYLRGVCDSMKIAYRPGDGAGKLQIEIFERNGEHTLRQPTFAYAYPAEVSPLARRNDKDPFITDRFEFFIGGRELANGFSELNDAEDQAQRFKEQAARKTEGDEEAMYYDADYVRALEYGMPPAAGLGVGIDRLVMFFTDSASIRDVLLFPHMRPET